jgi:hypothetical protein
MTLSFSTQINKKPTYFIEKIIRGLNLWGEYYESKIHWTKYDLSVDKLENSHPKLHTIRRDKNNRWKAGNKIHFVINPRTTDRFQFAPVVVCQSVQKISIKWKYCSNLEDKYPIIWIDGKVFAKGYESPELKLFAQNDGFDSVNDFFNWFDSDFSGKIIHWTQLKY